MDAFDDADLAALRERMATAIADEDFEAAAELRDALHRLGGPEAAVLPGSRLRRQEPGKMGLGTDLPAHVPPKGWKPPKRPDPMTRVHKGRGGREG